MKFLNHCVNMKSSMTSEDLTTAGRPTEEWDLCVKRRQDSLVTKSSAIQTV